MHTTTHDFWATEGEGFALTVVAVARVDGGDLDALFGAMFAPALRELRARVGRYPDATEFRLYHNTALATLNALRVQH